jgi:ferritin
MLNKKVEAVLNEQLNREFYSAYLYLAMSAYFDSVDLPGFAHFMHVQYMEEQSHAMRIFNYILSVGGKVKLKAIDEARTEWNDIIEVFEETYKHECYITKSINEVLGVAHDERDYATINMLQWFISEQVEEEANVLKILNQLRMVEGKGAGVFMLDREMASRASNINLENPEQQV